VRSSASSAVSIFAASLPTLNGSRVLLPASMALTSSPPIAASSHHGYRTALQRDTARLLHRDDVDVVLLGSIATGKYVDVLLEIMGTRLLFPTDFVGRGDMSRGALMLRAARKGSELSYEPVAGAVRRGRRARRVSQVP
jgi:hypothetical protein